MAELDAGAAAPAFDRRDLLDIAEEIGDAQLACRFAYRALGISAGDELDPARAASAVLPDLERAHHKLGMVIAELRAACGRIAVSNNTLDAAATNLPLTAEEVREAGAALCWDHHVAGSAPAGAPRGNQGGMNVNKDDVRGDRG